MPIISTWPGEPSCATNGLKALMSPRTCWPVKWWHSAISTRESPCRIICLTRPLTRTVRVPTYIRSPNGHRCLHRKTDASTSIATIVAETRLWTVTATSGWAMTPGIAPAGQWLPSLQETTCALCWAAKACCEAGRLIRYRKTDSFLPRKWISHCCATTVMVVTS